MKKVIQICTACVFAVTLLCTSASAENHISRPTSDGIIRKSVENDGDLKTEWEEAQEFAYLDPENASPEMREKILSARNAIIYDTDWVADGFEMRVEDRDGNVIQRLPHFSELFPNWDLPVYDPEQTQADHVITIPVEREPTSRIYLLPEMI